MLAEPDDRTTARQGEHQQVVAVGGVDAHFWCGVIQFRVISGLPLGFLFNSFSVVRVLTGGR